MALEYEEVLKRAGILPGWTSDELDRFIDYILQIVNPVYVAPARAPRLRDPNDERILEVAIGAGAVIVTHNIRDFSGSAQFGVRVFTPGKFLEILEGKN